MVTTLDYALMAGAAYQDTRLDINRIPVPKGWNWVSRFPQDNLTGFEAAAFGNGADIASSTEIVISYAGTGPGWSDWLHGNTPLALGQLSDQFKQAADYYLQVRATNPGATISFTGHSLGGGLASLMAVMFAESATTFDQAPFRKSALTYTTTDTNGNPVTHSVARDLLTYLSAESDPATGLPLYGTAQLQKLTDFVTALSTTPAGTVPNESNVTNINVNGEVLGYLPLVSRIGTTVMDISNGSAGTSSIDLHSQALLTAMLQSGDTQNTTAADHTLGQASIKLPDLLRMVFDKNLFYSEPNNTDTNALQNFLEHIVRHQTGGVDGVQVGGDAMVTRFTSDLWKIAQDGGLTMNDWGLTGGNNNVSKALIAFAMQKYYEENNPNISYGPELFTDLSAEGLGSNGITFDMHNVSKDIAAAMDSTDPNVKVDLAAKDASGKYILKGFEYFQTYLNQVAPDLGAGANQFTPAEKQLILSSLPVLRDWYVQAGANGMLATDTMNRGAFMLGGSGADALVGGTGADLLVGNAGTDLLQGGQGNDTLLGGTGNDAYVYATGDGLDTILDTGGQNTIAMDGNILAGGEQYGDTRVHRDANGHLYVQADPKTLLIDGNIVIQNYGAGGAFGLNLSATPVADPVPSNTIVGDLAPIDQDPAAAGIQLGYDALSNVLTDPNTPEPGRADILNGSAGNDILEGRAGSDVLDGGTGNDRLYADTQIGAAAAIAQGNAQTGTGLPGDWLNAGAGDDTLVGSAGNDLLAGGAGADLLIGGAGDDALVGDNDTLPTAFPAQTWHYDAASNDIILESIQHNTAPVPALSGNDVLYAGAGNDLAFGGYGNDIVFGEAGDDILQGNGGNDVLLGGADNDHLYGDTPENSATTPAPGDDYLDGGAGDDVLYGNEGNDILIGGADNDVLHGGAGQDTYIYNKGDGIDHVHDTRADRNIIRFGAGITQSDIANVKLHLGSLVVNFGNGDMIHINNEDQANANGFDQTDVFNSSSIDGFEFADGSTLTTSELLARGFDLDGTAGDDQIVGTNTTDRINGYGGNDTLIGMGGNDTLDGGSGNDTVVGDEGDDVLLGGAGDDHLVGDRGIFTVFGGNDTLDGGSGNDLLEGGIGSDIYLWVRGSGQDTINNTDASASTDILRVGSGLVLSDLLFTRSGNDLLVKLRGTTDQVSILNHFNGAAIDRIEFDNGDVLDQTGIAARIPLQLTFGNDYFTGTDGNEIILALDGNDVIDGMGGTDSIWGGNGVDILIGGAGDDLLYGEAGDDRLHGDNDGAILAGGNDSLDGGAGNDILEGKAGNDVLRGGDGNDSLYGNRAGSYTTIASEDNDILEGGAGNDTLWGQEGNDSLSGGDGVDNLFGGNGADILNGGLGNDGLFGGMGNDIYLFNRGDGQDIISEYDLTAGNVDTVRFGAGIAASDITVTRNGNDLVLGIYGTSDSVRVQSWWAGGEFQVEQVEFIDGTVWDVAALYAQSRIINGTSGNDSLFGDAGDNILQGRRGNDSLRGGKGNDVYLFNRGDGQDTISEQDSTVGNLDTIRFGQGILASDIVFSHNQGDLTLGLKGTSDQVTIQHWQWGYYQNGDTFIERVEFADGTVWDMATILAQIPSATLVGTSGDDTLVAWNDPGDFLQGLDGNDTLIGGSGNDTLNGGAGNDLLVGGAGDDTYVFEAGNGIDTIVDTEGTNTIVFGAGVDPASVTLGLGSLLIKTGNGEDAIHIQNFDPNDVFAPSAIESFQFADGSTLSYTQLLERGFDIAGTAGDDTLSGTNTSDRISGGAGNDILCGGAGNDVLNGGTGSDTYVIDANSGQDTIMETFEPGSVDKIVFASGIVAGDLITSRTGAGNNDLTIAIRGTDTLLTVQGWFNPEAASSIGSMEFADGSVVAIDSIINHAPTVDSPLVDQAAMAGEAFNLSASVVDMSGGVFSDVDIAKGDSLTYSATLSDGSPLPAWLTFDATTGTFSGTPASTDAGILEVAVTATDTGGLSATTSFQLSVESLNAAPVAIADLIAINEDVTVATIAAADLLANDTDPDAGDVLSLAGFDSVTALGNAVSQNAGGDLVIDIGSRFQSLGYGQTVSDSFVYTVTDASGLTSSATVDVAITGVNDAPVAVMTVPDHVTQQDAPFSFNIPAGTFTDIDNGDVLTYSATLADGTALPGWLSFDAATQTFSGMPGNWDVGNYSVTVTATDTGGLSASSTFAVDVANVNDAPTVSMALLDQGALQDAPFSFTVPAGTFNDVDFIYGDTLTYSATLSDGTALPGWLSFDTATGTFSGTPANGDVGSLSVLVTAIDTGGLSASSTFNLNVVNVNDTPTANADTGAAVEDGGAVLLDAATLLANDTDPDFIHGDVLNIVGVSQAASGAAVSLLNGAVQYDAGTLFQSLGQGQTATDTFSYTVSDMAGATSTATVTMTITGVNDGPIALNDAAAVQEDAALVATGNVLANDTDVDQGTVLSVANSGTLQGSYGSLVLNADGSYLYMLDNTSAAVQGLLAGQSVIETFAYQATDGIAITPATLTVTISGSNDAPVAQSDTATVDENSLLAIQSAALLANDTDADIGDTKALVGVDAVSAMGASISLANGQVVYDHGGRFNSLMSGQSVTDSFSYTMTDSAGAISTATVNVTVTGVNDGPQAANDAATLNEDTPQLTLTAASLLSNDTDPDAGDALSISGFDGVTALGNAVSMDAAGNLVFDIGNRYQYLAQGETLTDTFGYTITDIAGATSTAQVSVTITGVNDAPIVAADTATVQEDITLTAIGNVLANDSDIDQGAVLSVADAGVRAGSYGSLALASDGSYSYSLDNTSAAVQSLGRTAQVAERFGYTATDGIAGTASVLDVFLSGANDAPILVSPLADQYLASDKHFSWQMPAGSFTDIDQGDVLDYTATLADGSALPEWLKFDATTRTFSGEAPKERGALDVRITATDKVAATGSTVGSLSASDVFHITVSRGNEGVGNGQDAPPPGHDKNSNDGAGTSPGHPGSRGGNNRAMDSGSHAQGHESDDRSSDSKADKRDAHAKDHEDSGSRRTDELIQSWFDKESASEQFSSFSSLSRKGGRGSQTEWQVNRNVAKGVAGDVSSEWERMNARLKQHLEQGGGEEGSFADSSVGSGSFGLYGMHGQQSIAQLGMGNSQQMKGFAGLREGLERLAG